MQTPYSAEKTGQVCSKLIKPFKTFILVTLPCTLYFYVRRPTSHQTCMTLHCTPQERGCSKAGSCRQGQGTCRGSLEGFCHTELTPQQLKQKQQHVCLSRAVAQVKEASRLTLFGCADALPQELSALLPTSCPGMGRELLHIWFAAALSGYAKPKPSPSMCA